MPQSQRAIFSLLGFVTVLGFVLFGCAGTVGYWEGWVYLAIFGGASALITLQLARSDPALLERRMRGGPLAETQPSQKVIQSAAGLAFIALLVLPALDARFGWSHVPLAAVIAGDILTALSFYCISLVFKENTFTSSTIELSEAQYVIDSGPYALVRHPMYAAALLLFAATPLALACWVAFAPAGVLGVILVLRLLDEERFLTANLRGYAEYRANLRWRLIPGIF